MIVLQYSLSYLFLWIIRQITLFSKGRDNSQSSFTHKKKIQTTPVTNWVRPLVIRSIPKENVDRNVTPLGPTENNFETRLHSLPQMLPWFPNWRESLTHPFADLFFFFLICLMRHQCEMQIEYVFSTIHKWRISSPLYGWEIKLFILLWVI